MDCEALSPGLPIKNNKDLNEIGSCLKFIENKIKDDTSTLEELLNELKAEI